MNECVFSIIHEWKCSSSTQDHVVVFLCSHYPKTSFTIVTDTPENLRLKQQSELQSQVSVARDMELELLEHPVSNEQNLFHIEFCMKALNRNPNRVLWQWPSFLRRLPLILLDVHVDAETHRNAADIWKTSATRPLLISLTLKFDHKHYSTCKSPRHLNKET